MRRGCSVIRDKDSDGYRACPHWSNISLKDGFASGSTSPEARWERFWKIDASQKVCKYPQSAQLYVENSS